MNMNPVTFDTRAACCKLCVTTTIQYFSRSACRVSSTRKVEIGSSAAVGSSSNSTSGFTATARGMDRARLCSPARQTPAVGVQLVLDLIPYRRIAQRGFHARFEFRAAEAADQPQAERYIV